MVARNTAANISKTIVDIVLIPIFVLSYLAPRSDGISVYGYSNGTSFTDNSKYQFVHASRNESGHRAVWLSRNERVVDELRSAGYEAHRFHSLAGVYLTLRAGVVFVTHTRRDVPWWVTGGADVVRLGHGIPFKKYGRADPGYRDRKPGPKRIGYELIVANYTYTIATSERYADYVSEASGLEESAVHVTGLPRNDMPHLEEVDRLLYCDRSLYRRLADRADEQVIFYFPTYRDGDAQPIPDEVDFERLDAVLREVDSRLLVRPHINTGPVSIDLGELERIEVLDDGTDFYPLLEHVDLFVTDYSSLFHDSVFYDVPVLFFAHDLSAYTERRAFFFEYDEVPGDVVVSADEFHERLATTLEDLEGYAEAYADDMEEWREATFDYHDDDNCERVARRFLRESATTD